MRGDGINDGTGLDDGPFVRTGDGAELGEGPDVRTVDNPELDKGPADGARLRGRWRGGISA